MNISISEKVKIECKEKLKGSISAICERALKKALNHSIEVEDEVKECAFCGKNKLDMIWSGDLEKWVCNTCNNAEVRRVPIAAKWLGK